MTGAVQIVVCMDTEGPCADPGNSELLADWAAVDRAMDKLFESSFRQRHPDPSGGLLRVGWFFLTWTGFASNPRERDFGYHRVRDHYLARYGEQLQAYGDEQCWHYHQPAPSGVGNEWGLDWAASREYEQILSRQLLERDWFPACFRAGGTILTAESSRWVDAWFPIDYSNRAPLNVPGLVDWSSGVAEWAPYHPSPEDFRRPGPGRRLLARCLDLRTNVHVLTEDDVVAAFRRARKGRPATLAVFDHDYRDIVDRLDDFRELVLSVAARFSDVPWRYGAPIEAIRRHVDAPRPRRVALDAAALTDGTVVVTASEPVFQTFPWLAVQLADGQVEHVEEGIVRLDERRWQWRPAEELEWAEASFGVSTPLGVAATVRLAPTDGPGVIFLERALDADAVQPRSVWHHSKLFVELCRERASGAAAETDSVAQALDHLRPLLEPGMSLLDVGCGAGHLWRSLVGCAVDYHGIDSSERAIEIGRALLGPTGLPGAKLRALALEQLPPDELYDAVVGLNVLHFFPQFHAPLEAMARAARRWLVLRASFGDRTETRYVPDILLEPSFQTMRAYINIFDRREVEAFLEAEGFRVEWQADARQRDRFDGEPEVVGGVPIPYEFLLATRVAPPPTDEELLGALAPEARRWLEQRDFPRVG